MYGSKRRKLKDLTGNLTSLVDMFGVTKMECERLNQLYYEYGEDSTEYRKAVEGLRKKTHDEIRVCANCFDEGYNGKFVKGSWVCSCCLENNNVNFDAISNEIEKDNVSCECGNTLTGWDNYCNQCGRKKGD